MSVLMCSEIKFFRYLSLKTMYESFKSQCLILCNAVTSLLWGFVFMYFFISLTLHIFCLFNCCNYVMLYGKCFPVWGWHRAIFLLLVQCLASVIGCRVLFKLPWQFFPRHLLFPLHTPRKKAYSFSVCCKEIV